MKNRLNKIHEYLFEELYPFADKYRKVNLIKEKESFLFISNFMNINDSLNSLFEEIGNMLKNCYNSDMS